ncbi:MAG: hypothetical protein J6M92_03440 [Oribacterium sp.]|nr:hypothetical protein [Oribacterium sp.]
MKIKPNLDLELIQKQLLDDIVQEYDHTGSINKAAKNLGLSNMKVRKALITAGVYSNVTSEEVERNLAEGKSIEEISARLGISVSAVYGYIPYKVTAYNLEDRSVSADRIARYRERQKALKALKRELSGRGDWTENLWSCIVLYQGQKFKTSGRGSEHKGAVGFTYSLKTSGITGEKTEELVFSTREKGKTVTRSSVERAFETALEIQKGEGYVSGPKKIGGFGASYLYAIFLKWGVIKDSSLF